MTREARDGRRNSKLSFWEALRRRPHSLRLRKILFQIHMWMGVGVGIYVLVATTSGAALVFRTEIQRAAYPPIFSPPSAAGEVTVDISGVVQNMTAAYPEELLVGVSAPNPAQDTYVGYLSRDDSFRAVFADPITGKMLGTLPEGTWFEWLQNLHFYLFSGETGLIVNGVGGLSLFVLCVTGLALWWPGVAGWKRNLTVDLTTGLKRTSRDLHHAMGFWTVALIALLALSGSYFAFPQFYRTVIGTLSPMTRTPTLTSDASGRRDARAADLAGLVAAAEARLPGSQVARVSLPRNDSDPVLVVVTRTRPAEREDESYVYFYFDQFTGEVLHVWDLADRTWGDRVIPWIGRFHVGAFGGLVVKLIWSIVGFAPPLLFLTGITMWWNRVMEAR